MQSLVCFELYSSKRYAITQIIVCWCDEHANGSKWRIPIGSCKSIDFIYRLILKWIKGSKTPKSGSTNTNRESNWFEVKKKHLSKWPSWYSVAVQCYLARPQEFFEGLKVTLVYTHQLNRTVYKFTFIAARVCSLQRRYSYSLLGSAMNMHEPTASPVHAIHVHSIYTIYTVHLGTPIPITQLNGTVH